MIGRVVKRKYKIYDEVGSGGFAAVYLGRNLETNEIVAIKVLNREYTSQPQYVERFHREAQLAERLRHPNIVRVLDHGIEDGLHFLAMEYVEGLTLEKEIRRKGRLSIEETRSYSEQACLALQAAHEAGVVHRDIKPANLMVTPDGTLKIMDFGIARVEAMLGLTQTGTFMGTPRYLSPESAQGEQADIRSDLYALGLVMYEMLTGLAAFDGETPWAVLRKQIEVQPRPVHLARPDVPPWLEAVVLRALAKDPAKRFQTPAEMLAALKQASGAAAKAKSGARRQPAPIRTQEAERRRRPGLMIGLGGIFLVIVLGAGALFLSGVLDGGGQGGPAVTVVVPGDTPVSTALSGPTVLVITNTPAQTDVKQPQPTETAQAATVVPTDTPARTAPPATDTPVSTVRLAGGDTSIPSTTATATASDTAVPTLPPTTTPKPVQSPAPTKAPTKPPAPTVSGRIAYSAGGWLHIVKAASGQDLVAPIAGFIQPDLRSDGQVVIAKRLQGPDSSMWTINANTGGLAARQSDFSDDYHPFWSPDGSRFAYDSFHHGLGRYQMLYLQGLASPNPQSPTKLGYNGQQIIGISPVWTEDDRIAFTGCDYWPGGGGGSNCGIYLMPSWGGAPLRIKAGGNDIRATDSFGTQLLLMTHDTGDWEVYSISNDGGGQLNLTQSPGSADGLGTFSPDGKLVAFVSDRDGKWAVWAVRANGSGMTRLFDLPAPPTGTWTEEHIAWGP